MAKCPWRVATGVICIREDGQILLGCRNEKRRSFGGYWTFPGGTVSQSDTPRKSEHCIEWVLQGALRELGEEAGVWISQDPGLSTAIDKACSGHATALNHIVFEGARLEPLLTTLSHDRSGRGLAIQYFVLKDVTDDMLGQPSCNELRDVRFFSSTELDTKWKAGEMLFPPSVATVIECLIKSDNHLSGDYWAELKAYPFYRWNERYVAPSWNYYPYLSPTLPPETTTNCIWLGDEDFYIIDPAPLDVDERNKLKRMVEDRIRAGFSCRGIVLTHGHQDHIGAAHWLKQQFDNTIDLLGTPQTEHTFGLQLDRYLKDGDMLALADGDWQVIETPGHCVGHICLYEASKQTMVVGDMVSTDSSVLIEPHFGHVGTYLEKMEHIIGLSPRVVIPAHGLPIADGTARLKEQYDHRISRIEQLKNILHKHGRLEGEKLVDLVYGAEVLPHMRSFAAASIQAMLEYIEEQSCRPDLQK